MTANSSTAESSGFDRDYQLDDRYRRETGRVFLTGVQALVRLPLMQHGRDRAAGLRTAGFISGYRGSPLGTYDFALWQARDWLEQHDVRFEPGVNEDLAATAVWGSQQANLLEGPRYDGVFGIWYGKGPGVDRSCDALKHANYAGTAPLGGVLALTGDDPGAKSSSIAHQSETALIHCGIPILNPASVQDYLDLGIYGFALSRYSGCWVGFKCLTDSVDSSRSVSVGPERVAIATPRDFEMPAGGLNIAWGNLPLAVEQRLYEQRLLAAQAFVRANGLDRVVFDDGEKRRFGIVTVGKAYLDVRQALDELGIDERRARELGLAIYKVAMPWPLEPEALRRFAAGREELLVVEEKRPIIEEQLASTLYNLSDRPRLLGKRDERGAPLVPNVGELSPTAIVEILRDWLQRRVPELDLGGKASGGETTILPVVGAGATLMRLPSFCSGCPHNTSTVVPEGSVALGGIGCHGMAVWMPDRRTLAVTQMGGEGANWIGQSPFTETSHIFQNLGDGTYFHSGLLAIRAAVTAGVNITYKVLANGAVAMTGGQTIEGEVLEGEVTAPEIARQLHAEKVEHIVVVSDDIEKYDPAAFPKGVTLRHRDELMRVQKELREVEGVSAIVYDQTCAAEARRLRKRGEFPDPDRRIVINELVCEGCGDCSVQSNCISIEPIETAFGRKRTINQSSCNKDYSCIKGQCPSFVSVIGGKLRAAGSASASASDSASDRVAGRAGDRAADEIDRLFAELPAADRADCQRPFNILVAGIGGTGVVTVGALISMAAHLENKGVSGLDVTGLAQKNGPVTSHVRVAEDPEQLFATRIARGAADLVLGCDIVVAAGAANLPTMSGRTTAVVNNHVAPTADFAATPDLDLSPDAMTDAIQAAVGESDFHIIAATRLATALLGDAIACNLFLVGYAMQLGRLPIGLPALLRAIELNGRSIELNKRALSWGRLAAHDPDAVRKVAELRDRGEVRERTPAGLEEIVASRVEYLKSYQNEAYARRYRERVEEVAAREAEVGGRDQRLATAVAKYYFKLLAYKDEFEVARLYSDGSFQRQLDAEFEGDYRVELHLAPPRVPIYDWFVNRRDPDSGRVRKIRVGPWALRLAPWLAKLKFLRGTSLNPFGYSAHRRLERQLIGDYETCLDELSSELSAHRLDVAVEIASLPEQIRGFEEVREKQIDQAREKQAELLSTFRL